MAALEDDWLPLIQIPRETSSVEYKRGECWEDLKIKVVRTCLALANHRDGGYVVIGVARRANGELAADGISSEHLTTYDHDNIQDFVNKYADPFVHLESAVKSLDDRYFYVIRVQQFRDVPVLCKKQLGDSKQVYLRRGDLLVRAIGGKPETRSPALEELRELLRLAIDDGIRAFTNRAVETGLVAKIVAPEAETLYAQERGEL